MMENKKLKTNKAVIITKFVILIIMVAFIPLYIIIFRQDALQYMDSFENAAEYLRTNRIEGIFVYFFAQCIQILIFILPGQVFQFAAGYVFGFLPGLIYSIIGAFLGGTITFYAARFLGRDAVALIVKRDRLARYDKWLSSKKVYLAVFIIYLIPGMPKDLLTYAAGVSKMPYRAYIVLSTAGRIPAMCGSLLIGAFYMRGNYTGIVFVLVICVALLIIAFIRRKEVHGWLDKAYDKLS